MRPWYTGREEVKDNHKTIFFLRKSLVECENHKRNWGKGSWTAWICQ
jgi:hypothetical protein